MAVSGVSDEIADVNAGIVGTTSWGTALGMILAGNGVNVRIWARTETEARLLQDQGENIRFLPGHPFPDRLTITASQTAAFSDAEIIVIAVPSKDMRWNLRRVREQLAPESLIVSATKGLEADTGLRMTQVIAEELPDVDFARVCVLSGPNLAREIADGLPTSAVVSSESIETAQRVQDAFTSNRFRVYTNADIVGTELGGSLKNIIAIVAGIADGLRVGDNAKAGLISRAIAEIMRVGTVMGAEPLTFAGLTGLGDLMATCYSPLSRNRHVGEELGKGRALTDILADMDNIAEGVDTTRAALVLADRADVDMPITRQLSRVLWEDLDLMQAISELMSRVPKEEMPVEVLDAGSHRAR